MKKILVLSNVGILSAAFRYRIYDPLCILEEKGDITKDVLLLYSDSTMRVLNGKNQLLKVIKVCIDILCFIFKVYLRRNNNYDVVIVKTNIFPLFGAGVERNIYRFIDAERWIFDLDDGVYFNYTRKENAAFGKYRNLRNKVGFWLNVADKVTLSNNIIFNDLQEIYGLAKDKCSFFLSSPYQNQYFDKEEDINVFKKDNSIIWLGSAHTQNELLLLSDFMNEIEKYLPNVEVVLMGCEKDFPLFRGKKYVRFIEWTPENEREEMRRASFGLNPLRNDIFQQRKSAFKVIQYYRAGIIPIVSNVGINKKLVEKYGGCFVDDFGDMDKIVGYMEKQMINIKECRLNLFNASRDLSVEKNAEVLKRVLCK